MKTEAKIHLNPFAAPDRPSGVFGYRLEPGDVLADSDLYASTSGSWESCNVAGLTLLPGVAAIWIRPESA